MEDVGRGRAARRDPEAPRDRRRPMSALQAWRDEAGAWCEQSYMERGPPGARAGPVERCSSARTWGAIYWEAKGVNQRLPPSPPTL